MTIRRFVCAACKVQLALYYATFRLGKLYFFGSCPKCDNTQRVEVFELFAEFLRDSVGGRNGAKNVAHLPDDDNLHPLGYHRRDGDG